MTHGVLQGTVLGPLFFIIFINNLFDLVVIVIIICFADDTVILLSAKSTDELYSKANMILLELNLSKTKYMHFRINNTNHTIHEEKIHINSSSCNYSNCIVYCSLLEEIDNIKYLGLFYDNNLKWYIHIHFLTRTIRQLFYILRILDIYVG